MKEQLSRPGQEKEEGMLNEGEAEKAETSAETRVRDPLLRKEAPGGCPIPCLGT